MSNGNELLPVSGIWKNKKNQSTYLVSYEVINATNSADGQIMVQYHPISDLSKKYVREKQEFLEKFEPFSIGGVQD